MTNGPNYHSDEEIVKRLQAVLRAAPAQVIGNEPGLTEARTLVAELAERIFAEPDQWGVASIPAPFREDAVMDAFVAMLYAVPDLGGRQRVSEWFNITVESRFRRLWSLSERQSAERERLKAMKPEPSRETPEDATEEETLSLFEAKDGVWGRFEQEFPRDAFALRLRYLLRRSPEEMAVMLDAPSSRAISMRLGRARDRFRMFCEQAGMSRRYTADLMAQIQEERGA